MKGLMGAEEVGDETYYCVYGDTVDDADQQRITAEYTSFTVWDLIESHGVRTPSTKPLFHSVEDDTDLRIGQITVSATVPSEAVMVWSSF